MNSSRRPAILCKPAAHFDLHGVIPAAALVGSEVGRGTAGSRIHLEQVGRIVGRHQARHLGRVARDAVGERRSLPLRHIIRQRGIAGAGQRRGEDGNCLLASQSGVEEVGALQAIQRGELRDRNSVGDGQVTLRRLELVQELVLNDVDFVEIDTCNRPRGTVPHIADLEYSIGVKVRCKPTFHDSM